MAVAMLILRPIRAELFMIMASIPFFIVVVACARLVSMTFLVFPLLWLSLTLSPIRFGPAPALVCLPSDIHIFVSFLVTGVVR